MLSFLDIYDLRVFLVSSSLCCFIIALTNYVPRFAGRSQDLAAVQRAHSRLTPRLGGIAVFGAIGVMTAYVPETLAGGWVRFLPAVALLFFVGLLEDLGFDVSPRRRLAAAGLASLLFMLQTGIWIPRVDIPPLDALLPYWGIGMPLTVFITAGAANGFNLIDGVNGLAGFAAITCAASLAAIAWQGNYVEMTHLATMLAAGILGFLLLNYPFGMLFLGDAGAYTIGFVLSWFGVSILLNVPDASAWAILLTLFWPVADTLLAIVRRRRRRAPSFQPDRLHVHQLVMRSLEIFLLGRDRRHLSNPLSTLILLPAIVMPSLTGVLLWSAPLASFLAFVGFLALFFGSYALAFTLLRSRAGKRAQHRGV